MALKDSMTHPDTNIQERQMMNSFVLCFRHSYGMNISYPFCTSKGGSTVEQAAELDH